MIDLNSLQFNDQTKDLCVINFSMSYDIFDYSLGITIKQFLKHIDSLMYKDKKDNK